MEYKYEGNSLKSGVYKLTNKKNNRLYIGSAKEFKERWNQHTASLRRNKHHNKYLQADFNKCGEETFVFEVIEVIEGTKDDRIIVEQRYIDLHYDKSKCYNLNKDASSPQGAKQLEKIYDNIQLLSPDLVLYTRVDSVTSFAKEHNLNPKCLWKLLNGQTPSTRGWKLANAIKKQRDPATFRKGENHPMYGKRHTEEVKNNIRLAKIGKMEGMEHPNAKVYRGLRLLSPDGAMITDIDCLASFCRQNDLEPTRLCAVLNGRRKSTKGWKLASDNIIAS